ncbi:uncharacterized protein LOC117109067 [Anneissia japonica]|uniref:uncharacterized protein LOC117109067 n=1 Tax=Anneissia japonica TaxID=1529436 RepID=UPI0014254BEC|nr:uncharacterized protein LOC117109067 [Anneissia japonica]
MNIEISSRALPSEIQERVVDRITGKTSQTIDNKDMTYIWDFAGQQLYYITHRIFLTSEAVYVILFNLLESMYDKGKKRVYKGDKNVMTYDMTNIQIIKYWMRMIFTYAVPVESQQQQLQAKKPQIVVVGTHSESLQGTDDEKKEKIEEQFGIIFEAIKGTPYECHVVRKIYAIDNKSQIQSEMLITLKQDVGGFLKAMPKTIPLKWLEFQRILQENGRTAVRMTHDEVCAVATKCGISVKNLIHTLNYLHDLGIILYFENNRLLKHTVITNPRKLIDIFKKIITVVEPHDSEKWATMIELWNKLDEEGILEEELVRHLWRDELAKDESSFEVFLELMKQFGLLCEQIKFFSLKDQESKCRSFFVPCRLKRSKDDVFIEHDTAQMVSIYMASEDFIPDSVFHPLVVSLIGMVQDMGYTAMLELFSNYANIRLGLEHTFSLGPVVINNKPSLKLEILRVPITQEDGTKTPTGEPSPRVCMQVLEFLKKEMKVLTSGMKHTGYKFRVLCWTSLREMHFHDLEECLENECIPCGKDSITTGKLQRMFKNKQLVTGSQMQGAGSSDTETAPPDEHLGYLEDKHLLHIAMGMGIEWKQLGVRLGLSWNRIQQICSDKRRLPGRIMDMLTEWRNHQNYETNQVEIMCRALKEQGLTELANNVFGSQTSTKVHTRRQLHQRHQKYDGHLADIDMLFIAQRLGKDWKSFGSIIGLKKNEIERIEMDFSPPIVDSSLEMLVKWRERQNFEVNHLVKMSYPLKKLGKKAVAKELRKYYQETHQK